jgi:glycine/D-amino acid oxidase-like deaminating enzyme
MGGAALYDLARRGLAPVGVEQHQIGHPYGSSYGPARVFRMFYDQPVYVRMGQAALPLWRDLEGVPDRICLR